jgi:hypothetical protein
MNEQQTGKIRSGSSAQAFNEVLAERLSRRAFLKSGAAVAALSVGAGFVGSVFAEKAYAEGIQSSLGFTELKRVYDETHHVAPGFKAQVLARWGDKVLADAPEWDAAKQTAAAQEKQFGYNNDFLAFMPLPLGSNASDRGLLFVNHEYPNPHVMFPGFVKPDAEVGKESPKELVDVGMASMGHSIVEIELKDGAWRIVEGSAYNRRISTFTEIAVSGPAAGHALLRTSADPTGMKVIGTASNCGGGVTPWGTVLSCEEFPYSYFGGDPAKTDQADHIRRIGMESEDYYGIARFYDRFNVEKEPNELNRWQWVVEVDPYDPASVPVKRTALGRTGHEGATVVVNKDGRVAVYMGDDDHMEYLYRFVSDGAFDAANRDANRSLLDKGVLSAARFAADGTVEWLPLVHGQGPLTAENGFADQGEVLVKCRQAADKVGATPMDRPEDFETSPTTGRVYAIMTKSAKRKADKVDAANPRPENKWGHIIELIPPGADSNGGKDADHAAASYTWDMLVLCGDPAKAEEGARFHPETTADGWFSTPDNLCFDNKGRLWIGTDGMNSFDLADGLFGIDTAGPARGLPKALFAAPRDAEVTGPCFTPDGKTLFLAVQHPGENSETIEKLTTRWPDFGPDSLPRPSVVAIMREDGGEIGG